MNKVLSSKNERETLINKAEAQKRADILHAEAQAKVRELEGIGLANQRKALSEGLKYSITNMCGENIQIDSKELTDTILAMQHIDMLNTAAMNGKNTFILDSRITKDNGINPGLMASLNKLNEK